MLDGIVKKYNNTVHGTISMKPINVTYNSYAEYNVDSNEKDRKFKVGDHWRIPRYKNILAKEHTPNWSKEIFAINKTKNTAPWSYVISDLSGEEIVGTSYEKELKSTNQKEFR